MTWSLKQTKQCPTCPWKAGTTVANIPNYDRDKHLNLARTIAQPGRLNFSETLPIMSCHYSSAGDERHCIGWLWHQLGAGNNIALRMHMRGCENAGELEIDGEQKQSFGETFE
ncbi:MAG TPA: DUF6283 family protein [Allocoleopsis sp.]